MIQAYPYRPSVRLGGVLTLCVASARPHFRVEFIRQGATRRLIAEARFSGGRPAARGAPDADWDWPRHDFTIPADWPPGVYLARLRCTDEAGGAADAGDPVDAAEAADRAPPRPPAGVHAPHDEVLFVVLGPARPRGDAPARARILYKLALFTWHAYNETSPGASLYTGGAKVTLRRPGGGAGGLPWDADVPDVYDRRSPRQVFAHWDAPFIAWLERAGYAVDYCTDLDAHADPALLTGYDLLLCAGHDEYWSAPLRANVEAFVEGGGNVAFFGANTCWWRVHLEDGDTAFACDRTAPDAEPGQPAADMWHATRSEAALTGVSYRHGGGWWDGARPALGFTVLRPEHWVFAGTGLRRGQAFGADAALVGYECDGCALERRPFGADPLDVRPSAAEGTPASFELLGLAWLGAGWQDLLPGGPSAATLGLYTRGGTVFNAATTDWPRVAASGTEPAVERITRNVLDRLSRRA